MNKNKVLPFAIIILFAVVAVSLAIFAYFRLSNSKPVQYDYVLVAEAVGGVKFKLPLDAQQNMVTELMSYAKEQGFKITVRYGPYQHQANITLEIEGLRWEIVNPFGDDNKTEYDMAAYFDTGDTVQNKGNLERSKANIIEIFQKNGGLVLPDVKY